MKTDHPIDFSFNLKRKKSDSSDLMDLRINGIDTIVDLSSIDRVNKTVEIIIVDDEKLCPSQADIGRGTKMSYEKFDKKIIDFLENTARRQATKNIQQKVLSTLNCIALRFLCMERQTNSDQISLNMISLSTKN